MAKDPFEQFQIPNEMRAFAEQSVAQARKAFDGFIQAANQAVGHMQGHAKTAHKTPAATSGNETSGKRTMNEINITRLVDTAKLICHLRAGWR